MITASSVSSELITIHASSEVVWSILIDFENYALWNDFCPKIDGKLELGEAVTMQVDLGFGLQENIEYITKIEPYHTLVWSMENNPGDPIHADRYQSLVSLDEECCTYETVDYFSGDGVALMIDQMGQQIEAGFNQCARGLKSRAEDLYRQIKSGDI